MYRIPTLRKGVEVSEKQTTPTLQGSCFLSPALACRNLSPAMIAFYFNVVKYFTRSLFRMNIIATVEDISSILPAMQHKKGKRKTESDSC